VLLLAEFQVSGRNRRKPGGDTSTRNTIVRTRRGRGAWASPQGRWGGMEEDEDVDLYAGSRLGFGFCFSDKTLQKSPCNTLLAFALCPLLRKLIIKVK
jgi:hypothetical protein